MKRKIIVKEIDGDEVFISIYEIEEDPDTFLIRNGHTNFSWKYIEFGQKVRMK